MMIRYSDAIVLSLYDNRTKKLIVKVHRAHGLIDGVCTVHHHHGIRLLSQSTEGAWGPYSTCVCKNKRNENRKNARK